MRGRGTALGTTHGVRGARLPTVVEAAWVDPRTGEPRTTTGKHYRPPMGIGDRVAVRFDPAEPARSGIDWAAVESDVFRRALLGSGSGSGG